VSRAEVARETGLSRSTVSTLVGDLQARGLVVERADERDTGARQGRPALLLTLDPSAGAVVGLDLDHDKIRVAVSDLARTVLAEDRAEVDVDNDAEDALDTAAAMIERVLEAAGVERAGLLCAGMAIAGPVDAATGVVHRSAVLPSWAGRHAGAELEARIGVPVHVDNDANLGALAEVTLGAGRDASSAAYLQVSTGIGAGLVLDGRQYPGAHGIAGEIGHITVDDQGPICRCGSRGCLETLVSAPHVVELMRVSRGSDLTLEGLLELARAGDPGCRRAIADAGRIIGGVVAGLCNLFNPDMVVVGGDLSAAGDILIDPIREAIERHALPAAVADLRVVAGELGQRANLLGALALAISNSELAGAGRMAGGRAA
jgi:predicted NBD/HSP70 family sugar kinase